MDKELELLNEILSIPSVNGKDDERKIAEFICKYLQDNHVKAKVQYIDDRHANVLAVRTPLYPHTPNTCAGSHSWKERKKYYMERTFGYGSIWR